VDCGLSQEVRREMDYSL